MKIEILVPHKQGKLRSEHYHLTEIITATNQKNETLSIFTDGSLSCYLPEHKKDLHLMDAYDWTLYVGDNLETKFMIDGYNDDDLNELSINDMFRDDNWFTWGVTINGEFQDSDDVLDTYDDCLYILNKFIKSEI